MEGEPELKIKMLGGLKVFYGSREIFLSLKGKRIPKYVQLLLFLWLRGKEGASWDEISEYFFPGNAQKSMYNSVNNLCYNARRALLDEGLPEANFIIRQGRFFFADPLVPYFLDAIAFRGEIEKARETPQDAAAHYKEAFDMYEGDLLPEVKDSAWVLDARYDLKMKYLEAGSALLERAEDEGDRDAGDQILSRAVMASPDPKWEAKKVEALLCSGRLRDAADLYESVVLKYARSLKNIRRERIPLGLSFANENILSFAEHVCDALEDGKIKERQAEKEKKEDPEGRGEIEDININKKKEENKKEEQ